MAHGATSSQERAGTGAHGALADPADLPAAGSHSVKEDLPGSQPVEAGEGGHILPIRS